MKTLAIVLFPIVWAVSGLVAFGLGFSAGTSALIGLMIGLAAAVLVHPEPKGKGN